MTFREFYHRNKEKLVFGSTLVVMTITGYWMADILRRAIEESPIKITIWRLVEPLGLDAAAPGVLLFGIYLTALVLLTIDRTKRPQSVFLIIVTGIGLGMMAGNNQFFPYLSIGDFALFIVGVALAILYIGPERIQELTVGKPNDRPGEILEDQPNRRLEFRSAERLLYGLLAALIVIAFFEAHTDYQPLLERSLQPKLGFYETFNLTNVSQDLLAIDFGATGVFLMMLYLFLGYDAERTYFIVGPKRSGKTHAAIALHEEAEEHGYKPRNEAEDLIDLKTELVEEKGWLPPTNRKTQNLSFSFTSKGVFRKNIRLEALDYPGELIRAILPAVRFHTEPKKSLLKDYPNIETKTQWLEEKVRESKEKDEAFDRSTTVMDGGVENDSGSSTSIDELPENDSATDEAFAPDDESAEEDSDSGGSSEQRSNISLEVKLIQNEILPAFDRADTLLLIVDLEKFLAEESFGADALLKIFGKSGKDAIVIVTKADLIAEEFTKTRGWKSAWTDEAYDEFRTYLENKLSEHNVLRDLLKRVERPYPVGYQTKKVNDADAMNDLQREPNRQSGLENKRIQVHGYEYVLDRLN
jgi:hypothetical protein